MDPQTCTIILLKQANPYFIPDNDQDITLLESIFGHVHQENNVESCLNYVKLLPSSSTILLIDLDEKQLPSHPIEMIVQTVEKMTEAVPVIVYSKNEDTQFMLDCIQAGAADYLLRPLRPDVIKTLFLRLFRRQHNNTYEDHLVSSSTISTVTSVITPITPLQQHHHSSAYLPDRIQDRIKALNTKDINFTKAIIDTYIPLTPNTLPICKPLTSEQRHILEKKVSNWDFSPLNLSHDDLIHCTVMILSQVFTLSEVTEFSTDHLYGFIADLSNAYHDENPYHNFAHAVDVLQCIYYFLCQLGLLPFCDNRPSMPSCVRSYRILRPRDIFALLIAAIGHDTAHPGVNNAFLINTSAPLALLYNDNSVLESFHAMTLFQLLKKHKFDEIMGGSNTSEYNEFRKLVITSILSTDMALHSDYVNKIKEQKQRIAESDPFEWDASRRLEERLLFCSGLIKCADISNVARPFPRAFEWAQILVEEFATQGDLERELGMDVSPMNDRTQIVLEDSQIGFIRFVALGLFESVGDYMQELSFPVEHIKRNLSIWEDRKRENIENNHHDLIQLEQQHNLKHDDLTITTTTSIMDDSSKRYTSMDEIDSSASSSGSTTATEENYHSQAVHALQNKKELDSSLPKMPAVAMTSLSPTNNVYPVNKNQGEFDHYATDWDQRESSGPVYCQCVIQ